MKAPMLARVQSYLRHRRSLGYALRVEGELLLGFARFADRCGHRGPPTKRLALRWATLPSAYSDESGHLFRFVSDTDPTISDSGRSEATLGRKQ